MTNLAAIRRERRLTTGALSDRMSELGRPILANGITKIEKGGRRVDTDDLIALAVALDITPNALLLPPLVGGREVELTPEVRVPAFFAWRWATGEVPLAYDGADPARLQRFRQENAPHRPASHPDAVRLMATYSEQINAVRSAVAEAKAAGVPLALIKEYVLELGTPSDPGLETGSYEFIPAADGLTEGDEE